jgi:hypothetical protein
MKGQPARFESIGNRLGFRVIEENDRSVRLAWQGPRFPAFLCLGVAALLLFVSLPILQALRLRGFVGPAGSLWYFPVMNLVLFGISLYLILQRRTIVIDSVAQKLTLTRRTLHQTDLLSVGYNEIDKVALALDDVYTGFAVAGSSAAQGFPVPSLRVVLSDGKSILLDRGNRRRLAEIGKKISLRLDKPLIIDAGLTLTARSAAAQRHG